jgi:4-amino-4-deoxy-L-arabinose transferase-like glycosyltransferase
LSETSQGRSRIPSGAALTVLALSILVCLFGHLGAFGLVGPDEPRYAWIARAMSETGDWVTPRLYGQPWFEKPILYYWAAALGFRLHLPAEWAARLPSAIAAFAAAFAVGWLGWTHYGNDARIERSPAVLAPLLFSTSVAAIGFARAATPDMLFSASLTLAMASAAGVLRYAGLLRSADTVSEARRGDVPSLILFGAFIGLAVLAKGPAAIVLAGGAVLLWALATRQWRAMFRFAHPLAVVAFCAVALPWYIVCALRNPDFLRIFLFQHNFERYLTPLFQHRQPFWFFGPIVLLALLPWTALLWPAAREGLRLWRERSWADSPGFFFACWAIIPVVFFSFSQSKLPGYILPAIPALTLVCSIGAARALERSRAKVLSTAAALGLTWLVLAVAALRSAHRIVAGQIPSYLGYAALLFAVLAALAIVVAGFYGRPRYMIACCALSVVVSVEAGNLSVLPILDRFESARSHAQFLHNDQRQDRIFTYHLRRDWDYGLAVYFHRELPEWSPSDPDAALVLTTPTGFEEIQKLGRFQGQLDEPYVGVLYVPVNRAPR